MPTSKHNESNLLDNKEKIKMIDSESQFEMMTRWPMLLNEAIEHAEQLPLPEKIVLGSRTLHYRQEFSNVLICGMGGSAIGGAYTEAYIRDHLDIPIIISKKHHPPKFVSPSTLVIVCSYSGNTEETIQNFLAVIEREAPVIAISSGGMLTNYCKSLGIPILGLASGYRPRASLPLLFPPIPILISRIVRSFDYSSDFNEAINLIDEMEDEISPSSIFLDNPAKQVAGSIAGTIPMVCSSIGCISYRMRCQLNENSKLPAMDLEFPELGHNHIMGLESHPRNLSHLSLILLALKSESKAISARADYLKELALDLHIPVHRYKARGNSLLAQMLSLTYFGDYVSLYASVLRGMDPSSTVTIDTMKAKIEQEQPWKKDADGKYRLLTSSNEN
ncbi:MAG: bifunctional phosphoglucose/phosphomannose isomerase [Candidatus Hodarchaeales archaeon]|jgi:glucose/mannose-6-phosphate isomerase